MLTEEQINQLQESVQKGDLSPLQPLEEKLGLKVYTSDGLEKFKNSFEEDAFKKATSEIYSRIDNDFRELGYDVKDGAKTYDRVKNVLSQHKTADQKSQELQNQLEELKKTKDVNPQLQKEYEDIKTKYQDAIKQLEEKESTFNNQLTDFKKESIIRDGLAGLKFKSDIPDSLIHLAKENAINRLKQANIEFGENGKYGFIGENGAILKDQKTLEPLTANDLLKQELADIIETGKQVNGSGVVNNTAPNLDNFQLPADVKSQMQLSNYLKEAGLPSWDKKYIQIFDEYKNKLPFKVQGD